MSRWSFLLLGGDAGDSHVRRMALRVGIVSFVFGFFIGFFEPDAGEQHTPAERWTLVGLAAMMIAVTFYEGCRFFSKSDELVRRVLYVSQARAFGFGLFALLFYAVLEYVFGAPRPPTYVIALGLSVLSSATWGWAAWKST